MSTTTESTGAIAEPIADLPNWDTSTILWHINFYEHEARYNPDPLWTQRLAELRSEMANR